jgi:hypothetical protein
MSKVLLIRSSIFGEDSKSAASYASFWRTIRTAWLLNWYSPLPQRESHEP